MDKGAVFTAIVPMSFGSVLFLIGGEAGKIFTVGPVDPIVFYRLTVIKCLTKISKCQPVGAHKPIVGGTNQGIWSDFCKIKIERSDGLCAVQNQEGPVFFALFGDLFQVIPGTIGPEHQTDTYRRSPVFNGIYYCLSESFSPVFIEVWKRNGVDIEVTGFGFPWKYCRRELIFHQNDFVAVSRFDILGDVGQTV